MGGYSCVCVFVIAEVQALWDWWWQEGQRNISLLGGELGSVVLLFYFPVLEYLFISMDFW